MSDREALFRRLPRMDDLLDHPAVQEAAAAEGWSREFVREAATHVLDALREGIADGSLDDATLEDTLEDPARAVVRAARQVIAPYLRRVINGTGVVVHTNLGRAPWSASAAERVAALATAYNNLEFDLRDGRRGGREAAVRQRLRHLLPGADVAVVNNNAAAVLLVLNTFGEGREVIVSRGELVEIGGSFRIPDVMAKGFCRLREVGTTNRTRAADYRDAIGADTGLIMAVHPSNYRVVGFTESTPLPELVALGHEHDVPVVEDLGSGCLTDMRAQGIDEPTVAERLATGVDLVTFSGDKLLGGPQAGFIVGRPEAVQRCRANPLYRALRLDKGTLLALEATLGDYVAGRFAAVPAVRMIQRTRADLRAAAAELQATLSAARPDWGFDLVELDSRVGGGAAPEIGLPSWGVAVHAPELSADELASALRTTEPALVGRIVDDVWVLDARTLLDGDAERIAAALGQV